MGAANSICCCRYYLQHDRDEKHAILRVKTSKPPAPRQVSGLSESSDSDPGQESLWSSQGSQRSTAHPAWRSPVNPGTSTARGEDEDEELQAFINMRDQADEDTEEWEKLNYDIYTLRYTRREVGARWKKILLQLGYQCEVEALLCVNKQSHLSRDLDSLTRAREVLQRLQDHTSLFPCGLGPLERYLYVMDRLVSLDSAEDFIRLAKEKYPKTRG